MAVLVKKRPAIEDAAKLTGPEKAAVILLALGVFMPQASGNRNAQP